MMLLWPKLEEVGRGEPTDTIKSSPQSVPILPLEIIDVILREACNLKYPLNREERQVLIACTLVCKSWLPLTQYLLYYSVIVKTGRRRDYLPRIPGTFRPKALLQQSHILEFTRSLSIHARSEYKATLPLSSEDDSAKGSRKHVRIPDFFFPLAHTPQLRLLNLSVHCAEQNIHPFEPHIQAWLSTIVLPIEALDIDVWHLRTSFVYDLVGIWPTIRALRLSTIENIGLLPEKPSIRLRELRLPHIYSVPVIEWLLPPPPPNEQSSLRFLELEDITEEARAVLSVHGHSVSTLTLVEQPSFEFAHLFTKLEELVINSPFWWSPLPEFPRTLKHIKLDSDALVTTLVAQMVPILPDLRAISIAEKATADENYPDLQEVCKAHRVEILVYSFNSSGREGHPYHAEMDRFPRQYTFSEFFEGEDRSL
ncbi:hypothetical protein V8E53_013591 [Lactarius tabidus]